MIEWDHLRVVLEIHRGGSMTAAAESLQVDRATVVRRLDALESQLNSRLFDRRSDGCVLTGAGRNIIGLVEGVEQAMTALQHRVDGEDRSTEGSVRLAGHKFLLEHIVAPAMPTLLSVHPGLELDLRSDQDTLDLTRGEADIALRFARPVHEALVARRVGSVAVGLFAATSYLERRGTPSGSVFTGHDLLMLDGPLGRLPAMGWLLSQLGGANVPMRSDDVGQLAAAARAGAGITCVPAIALEGDHNVVPVAPGIVGRFDVYLATHRDLREQARVRLMFDFVVRIFAQRAASLAGEWITKQMGTALRQTADAARDPD